jgi:molybdopterin synthase catalytic subunit
MSTESGDARRPAEERGGDDVVLPDPARVAEETGRVLRAEVLEEPLEPLLPEARRLAATRAMGAVVVFDGVVRDHDGGRDVLRLDYSAHPLAQEAMRDSAAEVVSRHPRVRLWSVHRIGGLRIGESALTVVAAAAHRGDAFAACEDMADTVKRRVPIWKEQTFSDGGTEWVGL